MNKNYTNKCNSCNHYYCKDINNDNNKKIYCSGKVDSTSCPMYVIPIDCGDIEIFNILKCSIGQVVGLKLEGSDCVLRLKVCKVNNCSVMGKTCSGKGPIYIKLSSIQYVDLGSEVYINPLCSSGMGLQGPAGPKGDKGDMGPQGPKGPKGDMGPMGPMGPQGPAGPKGNKGDMGPMGPQGPAGPKGDKGNMGIAGSVGPAGPAGPQGPKGDKGDMGPAGPVGPQGPKGDKGEMGSSSIITSPTIPEKDYKKKKYPYNPNKK